MINILHSFPEKEKKFKTYCDLTFDLDVVKNTYVNDLSSLDNETLHSFDIVILHYLRIDDINFIQNNVVNIPIVWFCWGGDIFDLGYFVNEFILPKTRSLKIQLAFKKGMIYGIKELVKDKFPFLIDKTKHSRKKMSALKKIDYIVPVMPGDFHLIKAKYEVNFELYHLNYVNPLLNGDYLQDISGNNILLGNSASFSNNHIEAIDNLKKIKLGNRKIIIPLSYGNSDITEHISVYAKNKLGAERVQILDKFMQFEAYNSILRTCEIVIMNHLRQQAVGNIVQCLLNGAHLYLRNESTVFRYLTLNDFVISSFNGTPKIFGLSPEDKAHNRERARIVFGAKTQHDKLKTLLSKAVG